jgi:hypothetical protein
MSQLVRALALAVFLSAVAPELPIPIRTIGTSSASPRGSFVHGFFDYVLCVRRNRPAAGHFRGLAELRHSCEPWRRGPATLMGFDSGSALRSFAPSGGCEISFELTRPRAVEPRASRDVFDVRHRCRGPVAAMGFPSLTGSGRACSGFWGSTHAGQPSRSTGAAPPRHIKGAAPIARSAAALGFVLFQVLEPPIPAATSGAPIRSWVWPSRRSARCATAWGVESCNRTRARCHRFRRRREDALQRLEESDGPAGPGMFSRAPASLYEVSHRPRNARRTVDRRTPRNPTATSGATCLGLSIS